jgi:hypothetical protein
VQWLAERPDAAAAVSDVPELAAWRAPRLQFFLQLPVAELALVPRLFPWPLAVPLVPVGLPELFGLQWLGHEHAEPLPAQLSAVAAAEWSDQAGWSQRAWSPLSVEHRCSQVLAEQPVVASDRVESCQSLASRRVHC